MEIRYSSHNEDAKKYDTTDLRRHFLIEELCTWRNKDGLQPYR